MTPVSPQTFQIFTLLNFNVQIFLGIYIHSLKYFFYSKAKNILRYLFVKIQDVCYILIRPKINTNETP